MLLTALLIAVSGFVSDGGPEIGALVTRLPPGAALLITVAPYQLY